MNPPRRRSRAVVLALPGLIAFVLGFVVASREADAPAPAEPLARALEHADVLDPLSAAHGIAGLDRPAPKVAPAPPAARSPEELARAVAERITLVPYEGAMASPAQVLEGGVANGLDRARLLASLLAQAGHEARVVRVRTGDDATLRHAGETARLAGEPPPELWVALAARVDALALRAWARVSRERAWIDGARRDRSGEQRVSWVQVRRAGAWVDLLPPDTVVSADARRRAAPLDAGSCAWTVTLRVTNVWTDGTEDEALTFDAPAEALHARSLSYTNLPDRTLRRFVPTLVVGERRVEGAAFDLRMSNLIGRINSNAKQIRAAGDAGNVVLHAHVPQFNAAELATFIQRGPIGNMAGEGVFSRLRFDAADGIVEVTAAAVKIR